MLGPRHLPALLAALALTTGCGAGTSPAPVAPSTTSAPPTATPVTSVPPTPVGSGTPAATPTSVPTCTAGAGHAIPDGTWSGPITMAVRGTGGSTDFTDSAGRGTLRMVVSDGDVTSGTWTVRWRSVGHVDTGQAEATLDVVGSIAGTVTGTATKPRLEGAWRVRGTVTITRPVHRKAPVDETGPDIESMKPTAGCNGVRGSFVPSFTSKDAAAEFTGRADWAGTRQ